MSRTLFLLLVLFGLGSGTVPAWGEEMLRVGTYHHYPPLTISDDKGNITGFEVDLAYELCRRVNRTCTIRAVEWEKVFDSLDARLFDVYIGGMTVTEERRKRVAFTQPYAAPPEFFATTKGHALTGTLTLNRVDLDTANAEQQASLQTLLAALNGRRVGVHVETIHESFVDKYLAGKAEIVRYHSEVDQYADMVAGKVDTILDSGAVLQEFILGKDGKGQNLTLFGPALTGGPFGRGIGAALRHSDKALLEQLDSAIAAAKTDGTIARFALTWFGYNASAD